MQAPRLVALSARGLLAAIAVPILALSGGAQDTQDAAARKRKRLKDNAADFWIYDDIEQGYAKAKAASKPLLVSFRCVP